MALDNIPDKKESGSRAKQDDGFILKRELFDWAEALVFALAFIIIFFTFIVRLTGVKGTSMVPTLQNGDQLLISRILYSEPQNGDIVVINKEEAMDHPIVKRVIAVEGQTIDINFSTHEVIVDGEILYEPYINEPTAYEGDMIFPLTIPEGTVFVMGDNRNMSSDSRESRLGVVDKRYILGRVLVRVFPFDKIGDVKKT